MGTRSKPRQHLDPRAGQPFELRLTLNPDTGNEAAELQAILELLSEDNEQWLRRMLALGRDPPCCAKCAGVKYRPPTMAEHKRGLVQHDGAHELLRKGHGNCGTVVAYDVAAGRVLEGKDVWPEIVPGPWGIGSWHAVIGSPTGTTDPTLKMKQG